MPSQPPPTAKRLLWILGAVLTAASLACNLGAASGTPSALDESVNAAGPPATAVKLEIRSELAANICTLYISPVEDGTWGGDWLEGQGPIPPSGSLVFEVEPGQYDLMALGCDQSTLGETRALNVSGNAAYTFSPVATDAPPPTAAPESTSTPQGPAEPTGTIAGTICYPSDFIPQMTAYFEQISTGEAFSLIIVEGQQQYRIDLPPAIYVAYVWQEVGMNGGAFTQAVPCGLGAECSDHSLIPIAVEAGQTMNGVDLCDWYGPLEEIPLPP